MNRIIALTILLIAAAGSWVGAQESPAASATPAGHHFFPHLGHKGPAGLPSKWDRKIPIPTGATVTAVKPPVKAAQTVEFVVPGDFDQTVAFYRDSLPKAGFQLGPEVKVPARKVYNVNFTRAGVQDTLTIFPDKTDSSKLAMRIVYTPEKGWIRTKLAKWEDRARVLPKWWKHHEEEKKEKAAAAPAASPTSAAP